MYILIALKTERVFVAKSVYGNIMEIDFVLNIEAKEILCGKTEAVKNTMLENLSEFMVTIVRDVEQIKS